MRAAERRGPGEPAVRGAYLRSGRRWDFLFIVLLSSIDIPRWRNKLLTRLPLFEIKGNPNTFFLVLITYFNIQKN